MPGVRARGGEEPGIRVGDPGGRREKDPATCRGVVRLMASSPASKRRGEALSSGGWDPGRSQDRPQPTRRSVACPDGQEGRTRGARRARRGGSEEAGVARTAADLDPSKKILFGTELRGVGAGGRWTGSCGSGSGQQAAGSRGRNAGQSRCRTSCDAASARVSRPERSAPPRQGDANPTAPCLGVAPGRNPPRAREAGGRVVPCGPTVDAPHPRGRHG